MSADPPPDSKLTRSKQQWADARRFLRPAAPGTERPRLPPGQHTVQQWPVLDLGVTPSVDAGRWRLEVFGLVARPMAWDRAGWLALPQRDAVTDIHCVTTWSRFDNAWRGIATRDLLALVEPLPQARFVMLHGADGYTTNLPLTDFADAAAMLVHQWDGRPLTVAHGGPLRAMIPHLYFWKSAKWLQRIELREHDAPGFWEQRGYHRRGDPWAQQRYSDD